MLLLALFAGLFHACAALADVDRVALVVGNSAYRNLPILDNPRADAQAMADVLSKLSFENGHVEPQFDLDLRGLLDSVRAFGTRARRAKVAVVYFSGHGLQLSQINGAESFLLPVDADLKDVRDVPRQALALQELLGEADRTQGGVVVLLDACRNNPAAMHMGGSGTRGIARSGLLPVPQSSLPQGVLISYATSSGEVAEDGTGRHSPYTAALIQHLPTPERDIGQVLRRVRADVVQSTNGRQRPEVIDNLNRDVFLSTVEGTAATTLQSAPAVPAPAELQQQNDLQKLTTAFALPPISFFPEIQVHPIVGWSPATRKSSVKFGFMATRGFASIDAEIQNLRVYILDDMGQPLKSDRIDEPENIFLPSGDLTSVEEHFLGNPKHLFICGKLSPSVGDASNRDAPATDAVFFAKTFIVNRSLVGSVIFDRPNALKELPPSLRLYQTQCRK